MSTLHSLPVKISDKLKLTLSAFISVNGAHLIFKIDTLGQVYYSYGGLTSSIWNIIYPDALNNYYDKGLAEGITIIENIEDSITVE